MECGHSVINYILILITKSAIVRTIDPICILCDYWLVICSYSLSNLLVACLRTKSKSTFGLDQTNWAYIFLGIWGIFIQTISTFLALWVPCPWKNVFGSFPYKKLLFSGLKCITLKYDIGHKEFRKEPSHFPLWCTSMPIQSS